MALLLLPSEISGDGLMVLVGEEKHIDKQADNRIVNQHRSRETNRSPAQPFEPGAQRQMLALKALHGRLARNAQRLVQAVKIRPPKISEPPFNLNAGRIRQPRQLPEGTVRTPAENKSNHLAVGCVLNPPEPAGILLGPCE